MKKLLSIIAIVFFFLSCHKQKLEGDYCVCKVNGRSWRAGCSQPFANCLGDQDWGHGKRSFTLAVSNESQSVGISVFDTIKSLTDGTYILSDNRWFVGDFDDFNKSSLYSFTTDSLNTGEITIHFDEEHRRVSGTFHFKARFPTNEIVNVTDGQFSLPMTVGN